MLILTLLYRRRHGEPGGDGGEDQVDQPSSGASAHTGRFEWRHSQFILVGRFTSDALTPPPPPPCRSRPIGASRRRQRGEPEAKVWEPGARSVHREPHVGLERLPDDGHKEQAEVSVAQEKRGVGSGVENSPSEEKRGVRFIYLLESKLM